jgi:hypothetical protein
VTASRIVSIVSVSGFHTRFLLAGERQNVSTTAGAVDCVVAHAESPRAAAIDMAAIMVRK